MISRIRNRWYAKMRKFDVEILWPSCYAQAPDLAIARTMFLIHTSMDPAWKILGEEETLRQVNLLGAPE